ncbi:Nn.00g066130.m01.CDS01 [Neocucurbitaria sp. VM-36]
MPLIKRIQPTSDETPPWTGISFVQPVDSDALHEHLKIAYPQCTTLRERKHMAAIDFLIAELRQMQSKGSAFVAIESSANYPAAPSPRAPSLSTEALGNPSRKGSASASQSPTSSTQLSTSVEHAFQDRHSSTTPACLPPIAQPTDGPGQHLVFSAIDGRMMQPKTKRRMTIEEKNAYKETRKRGACRKCKRQKGKCTHVIDVVDSPKHTQDVKKAPKRRSSRDPDIDQQNSSKMAKLEHSSKAYQLTSDLPQPQQNPSVLELRTADNEVDNPPNQPSMVSGDAQWGQKLREMDRSEIARYVNHQVIMEPYGVSLPGDAGAEWTGFHTPASTHTFNPGYIEYVESAGQPEEVYPLASPHGNLRPDFSYPSEYSGHEAWTDHQEAHTRNANPD